MISIKNYISCWETSIFSQADLAPWDVTSNATEAISRAIENLDDDYLIKDDIAIHMTAHVEAGAIIKGPAIMGPNCFVAATAYLRDGVYLAEDCIVGPSCELKTTIMFPRSKVAHLSFVGDSLIGAGVNIEAGAIIANYRNELENKRILIQADNHIIDTGTDKFGSLIGDDARIGANAVIAPGSLISAGQIVPRLGLIDQHPETQPY